MPNAFALDKNRVRYAYLKANSATKIGLEKNVIEKTVATSNIISSIMEIDFGVKSFSSSNNQDITFDITFSEAPTVIAIPDDNVNISLTLPTTTGVTIHSSDTFTGSVYWIALNSISTPSGGSRDIAMIVDAGTTTFTSQNSVDVTFTDTKKDEFESAASVFDLTPTVLISSNENVNLYLSNVTPAGFTLNASEVFTGTAYWTALMIRKL